MYRLRVQERLLRLTPYALLFGRALLMTFLVALSTLAITAHAYGPAAGVSFSISLLWFFNARGAAEPHGNVNVCAVIYATGAACGTVMGTALGAFMVKMI